VSANQTAVAGSPPGATASTADPRATSATFAVILSLSFCHLLNDMMQSLVPAIFPVLKDSYGLSFAQVGVISLAFQVTASMFQPAVGFWTDKHPQPFSLAIGMASTLVGLLLMSQAVSYGFILLAAGLIGLGSAVFHPEASRVARLASGGRFGLAQSLFQIGGNGGTACGPLLAAFIVVPKGQGSIMWFSLVALLGMVVLFVIGRWYAAQRAAGAVAGKKRTALSTALPLTRRQTGVAVAALIVLLFSKNVYSASMGSYYTFYLIEQFALPVQSAQLLLFVYLAAVVVGTLLGGMVGDRVGRLPVMWFSILGALPFTLALPYLPLGWTVMFSILIAMIMASAFSAILVYAQDLLPGRVGMVAGIFYGFSFGLGGLGAAALGALADVTSIGTVYQVCSFLPLLGLATALLPKLGRG
jgi:FSR family fosmidomycin resistance protein-like MFS transporter